MLKPSGPVRQREESEVWQRKQWRGEKAGEGDGRDISIMEIERSGRIIVERCGWMEVALKTVGGKRDRGVAGRPTRKQRWAKGGRRRGGEARVSKMKITKFRNAPFAHPHGTRSQNKSLFPMCFH